MFTRILTNRGLPIDGVCLHMHVKTSFNKWVQFERYMERLGELGVEVHVTEVDVVHQGEDRAEADAKQRRVYSELLSACLRTSSCTVLPPIVF